MARKAFDTGNDEIGTKVIKQDQQNAVETTEESDVA